MIIRKIKNFYHLLQSLTYNIIYRFPAKKLTIIGVTGTDGKTTTTSMIYHVLRQNGFKVGMISTLYAKMGDTRIDTGLHVTTPEPWDLPRILRQTVDAGITHVVLESTSSGLDQNRDFSVSYDSATITNISNDHLDYHKTWENYANAKFRIILKTKKRGKVVLNEDHEKSAQWLRLKIKSTNVPIEHIEWYSQEELKDKNHSVEGISFTLNSVKFKLPIIGEYNFSNALGAIKICRMYLDDQKISKALETFQAPTGRMQIMQSSPTTVIVDFAHTPSSLEMALKSINKIRPTKDTKVICAFGCAGLRDKKRREMGRVSADLADITLITLEDPRIEKVKDINDEIIQYAERSGGKVVDRFTTHDKYLDKTKNIQDQNYQTKSVFSFDYDEVQNRIDAIDFALKIAKTGDIVFITGKGHEESLGIGNPVVENKYTDQDAVREIIH